MVIKILWSKKVAIMIDKYSRNLNKTLILFLSICLYILIMTQSVFAEDSQQHSLNGKEILGYVEGIINWKKTSLDIDSDDPLFNNTFLENAGDTSGDWYPIGMGRIGYPDEYDRYLAVIRDVVENRYQQEGKLDDSKATEWHRISLAILSSGGDPTKIGTDTEGKTINLISDGTYNRGKTRSLGTQGINGWIWGLIAMDSMRYPVPEDAHDTRQSIIEEIMKLQLTDGGFSLNSPESDPDIIAMAIQALAPYYNSEETYTYEQGAVSKEVTKTVREVIDEALHTLSNLQTENGDFESFGIPNSESTAQVIVALTSLGIDPLSDERFIKNDNTILDGISSYLMDDGGFIHAESYDPDNPAAIPDESNTMASEQILYSLAALYRNYENYRSLYDFREEMGNELKEEIDLVKQAIETIPTEVAESDKDTIRNIFNDYLNIPIEERSYVFNYYKLADAMAALGIENTSEPIAENMGVNNEGNGALTPIYNNEDIEEF